MVAGLDFAVNGVESFLGSLPLYLIVLWVVVVFLYKPKVKITGGKIRIANPFRFIELSLNDVVDLDTNRGLVLRTKDAKYPIAVAVAPGRYTVARANKSDFKWAGSDGGKSHGVVSPGDILDSDSGAVAFVVRQELKRIRESDTGSLVSDRPIVRNDYWSIVIGAALMVATLFQIVS